jgi:hypothetical protein
MRDLVAKGSSKPLSDRKTAVPQSRTFSWTLQWGLRQNATPPAHSANYLQSILTGQHLLGSNASSSTLVLWKLILFIFQGITINRKKHPSMSMAACHPSPDNDAIYGRYARINLFRMLQYGAL